mmetsp:Transcript_39808/g.113517  ORF Transcript_39808/g.113517 Transcript_39808/m.113517 type:complete len:355 (+) Transcript_39808:510-1574(+)
MTKGGQILPGSSVHLSVCRTLLAHPSLSPAGLFTLDMLRMEAGLPRAGVDITPLVTPVHASLTWLLDQDKMRRHMMFGWEKLFVQLAKGPTYRRVGFLADRHVFAGCGILSNPHRRPIGEVTSAVWSPVLKRRIAMGFIKPEYARHGLDVLVRVPVDVPSDTPKHTKMRWLSGRCSRKLVAGKVVRLPFVTHNYPKNFKVLIQDTAKGLDQERLADLPGGPNARCPSNDDSFDFATSFEIKLPRARRVGASPTAETEVPPEIAQEIARRKVKHHKQRAERRGDTGHGGDDGGDGERLMFLDDEGEVKVTSRMAADKGRPLRSKHRKRDNTAYIKATHSDRLAEAKRRLEGLLAS